jgi:hypothetical protein
LFCTRFANTTWSMFLALNIDIYDRHPASCPTQRHLLLPQMPVQKMTHIEGSPKPVSAKTLRWEQALKVANELCLERQPAPNLVT